MEGITGFGRSLRAAYAGLIYVVQSERNARIHLIIAIAVVVASVLFQLSNPELAAVFFAILLVFVAEIVNTAFEKTLDLIEPNHHAQVGIIKDVVAGAVLVAALGAVAIGFAVFLPHLTGAK